MKHYFTLFLWYQFSNLILQIQAQGPNTYPTVHLTYLQGQHGYNLYEYVSPMHGKSQPAKLIQDSHLKVFSRGINIFWENKNYERHDIDKQTRDLKPSYKLKLKLTCKGQHVTQWKINSGADDTSIENSDQAKFSEINYSVTPLSRDNENPLFENAGIDKPMRYNWTELTIESFGPNFKSGSIDCVMDGGENLKSRLYIFQRFRDTTVSPFKSNQGHILTFHVDYIIPCTVHDPGVKPTLTLEPTSIWARNPTDVSDTFTYHWKVGFTSTARSTIKNLYKFSCFYGSSPLVTYQFLDISLQPSTNRPHSNTYNNHEETLDKKNVFITPEVQHISTGGKNILKFTCRANESTGAKIELKSIQLFACASPDYCFPKSRANSTFKKCAQFEECSLVLPSTKDPGTFSIDTQGKVVCSAEIDQKKAKSEGFYYTTLSGNIGKHPYLSVLSTTDQLITQDDFLMNQLLDLKITVHPPSAVQVHCQALSFFTFPSIKFSIAYSNGTVASVESKEAVLKSKGTYSKTMELTLDLAQEVRNVACYAPPFDSLTWLRTSKDMQVDASVRAFITNKPVVTFQPTRKICIRGNCKVITSRTTTTTTTEAEPSSSEINSGFSQEEIIILSGSIGGGTLILLLLICCCVCYYCTIEFKCCPPKKSVGVVSVHEMQVLSPLKIKANLPPKFKLSERDILMGNTLRGEGQFSNLYQAKLNHKKCDLSSVVVKVNKMAGNSTEIAALLNDIQTRLILGDSHPNILLFLGAHVSRKGDKVSIALETENTATSLRDYLTNKTGSNGHEKIFKLPANQKMETFHTWLSGVAQGMKYMHGLQVIHGNIAAENVLLFPNNLVKLSGFSYAQQLAGNSKYFIKPRNLTNDWEFCGWKWMPMESLRYMEFSRESDVWSFGVFMWEIFSMGALPYIGEGGKFKQFSMEFVQKIEFGVRLPQPQLASKQIYTKMNDCWNRYGKDRPTFMELIQFFNVAMQNLGRGNDYVNAV